MLGVLQTGKPPDPSGTTGTSHSIWMTAAACMMHCSSSAVRRCSHAGTNGCFSPFAIRTLGSPRFTEEQKPGRSPSLVELPDLARLRTSACATVRPLDHKRTLLHSPAGKMHAQERGSLLDCFRDPRRARIHGRHQERKVRQGRERLSKPW
jgi:hypothetical protein